MKKISYILIFVVFVLFIGVKNVSAAEISYGLKSTCQNDSSGTICDLKLVVEGGIMKFNQFNIDFQLTGTTFNASNVNLDSRFTKKSTTATSMVIVPTSIAFDAGTYNIGTIRFYKIASAEECDVKFTFQGVETPKTCDDSKPEKNKYYNNQGKEIDQRTYEKVCLGKKFCDDSDPTNNKYYNDEGKEIDKATYEKVCLGKRKCEDSDPTKNKYYNDEGKEIDKRTYEKVCLGKKFCDDSDPANNKYYNDEGKEIDKATYEKVCLGKKTCEDSQPSKGIYYDNDGKKIDKKTYNAVCVPKVDNPKTGTSIPYIVLGVGTIIGGILLYTSKRYKKIRQA